MISPSAVLVIAGVTYLVLLVIGNTLGHTNPWDTTFADRVFWYPAEIALAAIGWTVMNAPLVAAAMIPLGLVIFIAWVLLEAFR